MLAAIMSGAMIDGRAPAESVPSDARFDWLMLAGATWLIAGIAIDGWAHNNIRPLIDTFFTPSSRVRCELHGSARAMSPGPGISQRSCLSPGS